MPVSAFPFGQRWWGSRPGWVALPVGREPRVWMTRACAVVRPARRTVRTTRDVDMPAHALTREESHSLERGNGTRGMEERCREARQRLISPRCWGS